MYLGHRKRGLIFLIVITITFWTGVAIGGVRGTIDPKARTAWFMAELCSGGNALAGLTLQKAVIAAVPEGHPLPQPGHWLAIEVGIHYCGVAGLLNLLVVLDAIVRADPTAARQVLAGVTPRGGP